MPSYAEEGGYDRSCRGRQRAATPLAWRRAGTAADGATGDEEHSPAFYAGGVAEFSSSSLTSAPVRLPVGSQMRAISCQSTFTSMRTPIQPRPPT